MSIPFGHVLDRCGREPQLIIFKKAQIPPTEAPRIGREIGFMLGSATHRLLASGDVLQNGRA